MYIQLCNNNDCHGNDYDAFGKRRDRIGGWRDRIGCLGKDIKNDSNAVSIAISRRRYPQQDNCQQWVGGNTKIEYNAYG